jgi:hypothetical protein
MDSNNPNNIKTRFQSHRVICLLILITKKMVYTYINRNEPLCATLALNPLSTTPNQYLLALENSNGMETFKFIHFASSLYSLFELFIFLLQPFMYNIVIEIPPELFRSIFLCFILHSNLSHSFIMIYLSCALVTLTMFTFNHIIVSV